MRHGQSVANAQKVVSGSRETPLSELGQNQARLAAHEVKKLGIDLIVCSPLKRARHTAEIIAEAIDYPANHIEVLAGLRERHLGKLEGQNYGVNKLVSGDYIQTEGTASMEPIGIFHSRVQHVLRELLGHKNHQNILIVCHNNVGRMLQVVAANKPALALYDIPKLENGHIQVLA